MLSWRSVWSYLVFFFPSSGSESELDVQRTAAVDGPATDPGEAQARRRQACGERAAAAGGSPGGGELGEEEVPAAGAAGAPGEADGDQSTKGLSLKLSLSWTFSNTTSCYIPWSRPIHFHYINHNNNRIFQSALYQKFFRLYEDFSKNLSFYIPVIFSSVSDHCQIIIFLLL